MSSENRYCIVEFPELKEVEVVSGQWIISGNLCWWPNCSSTKAKHLCKLNEKPQSNWEQHQIRILKSYDSYQEACKNLRRAEYDSDLSSDAEATPSAKRSVVKRTLNMDKYNDDDDELSEDDQLRTPTLGLVGSSLKMPPPPVVPTTKKSKRMLFRSPGIIEGSQNQASFHVSPVHTPTPSTSESSRAELLNIQTQSDLETLNASLSIGINQGLPVAKNSFESWVVSNMGILKARVKQVQEGVDLLIQNLDLPKTNDNASLPVDFLDTVLPLNSKENFDNLEMLMKDTGKRRLLVTKLAQRGGTNAGDCTRRVMVSLITDQFAQDFSWLGSRGDKLAFASTELKTVIFDAVRFNKPFATAKDQEIEKVIKDWLKNSKKRFASKSKKGYNGFEEHDAHLNGSERDGNDSSD